MPGKCIADMYRFTNTDKKVRYIPETTTRGENIQKFKRGKNENIFVSKKQQTFSAALIVVVFFLLVPGGSAREEESTWSFLLFVVVVSVDEVGRRPALLSRSSVIAFSFVENERKSPLGKCDSCETLKYNKKVKVGKIKHQIPIERY